MARDFVEAGRAKIAAYRKAIAAIEESLRAVESLGDQIFTHEHSLIRRPGAYKLADDIALITKDGQRRMTEDDNPGRLRPTMGRGADDSLRCYIAWLKTRSNVADPSTPG